MSKLVLNLTFSGSPKLTDRDIANNILTHNSEYHNHKETMSHAILLVEIGLLAFIISQNQWPPCKFINLQLFECFIRTTCIILHVLLRWQLIHRRLAAYRVDAATIIISNKSKKINCYHNCCIVSRLSRILDYFIPILFYNMEREIINESYPPQIKKLLNSQFRNFLPIIIIEYLQFIGSIFIIMIIFYGSSEF